MLMKDPLVRSSEYEKEIYAAAVQMMLAVIPRKAPAAIGNHSCAVLVTIPRHGLAHVHDDELDRIHGQYHNEPT